VEQGIFREDLFYRLTVFEIAIAPLRERVEDILPLSEMFLDAIGRSFGRPPAELSEDARIAMLSHQWPGNVRELRNALERAAILCEGGLIDAEHLALPRAADPDPPPLVDGASTDLSTIEQQTIARALRESDGTRRRLPAARLDTDKTVLPHQEIRSRGTAGRVNLLTRCAGVVPPVLAERNTRDRTSIRHCGALAAMVAGSPPPAETNRLRRFGRRVRRVSATSLARSSGAVRPISRQRTCCRAAGRFPVHGRRGERGNSLHVRAR